MVVDDAALAAIVTPRRGLVAEVHETAPDPGDGTVAVSFTMGDGPLRSYRRRVDAEAVGAGRWLVRQSVAFRIGVPWWSWLLWIPLRVSLGRLRPAAGMPWWAPPQRLDRRAAVVLGTLCGLALVAGYLDSVLTQTMTYAGAELGVGSAGQGLAFGVVQASAVASLAALALSDRRGRRQLILVTGALGVAVTALGALSPSLPWLTAGELVATGAGAAMFILLLVVATEEMPPGCRAWAAGVLALSSSLGAGGVLIMLPVAALGPGAWRAVYAVALVGIVVIAPSASTLPESRRFLRVDHPPSRVTPRRLPPRPGRLSPRHRRRLVVLGTAALAYALFATPASQFSNQFLRTERHFTPAGISLLQEVAGTIGGLGVLVGGRLADTRGRRPVAAIGVGAVTLVTLWSYFAFGWGLWVLTVAGSLLGFGVEPALAVYGPELFPTLARGSAAGAITVLGAAGGVVGLVSTGLLTSVLGSIGPALCVLAVGPVVMVVLVVVAFPESAGHSLEELNDDVVIPPHPGRLNPAAPGGV